MLITAVDSQELLKCATIGLCARSTSSDHWLSYPFEDSWHVRNGTSSDGNSSDEVFFCFHNGFIHQLLHVPPEEEIQTREVRWPGLLGHRTTSAGPSIPEGGYQMIPHNNAEMGWAIVIHRAVYQMHVSHFSMHKPFHVHRCCHKAVMIATESVCFQVDLRAVLNVSTHSQSATPTQQLTSPPLTKCSLILKIDFGDHMFLIEM